MFHPDFFRQPGGVFSREVLLDAAAHAVRAAPNEACGLVRAGRYSPCENVAADPTVEFEIAPVEIGKAFRAGDLEGVIHSHPGGPWWPSRTDMVGQIETRVPWAILVPGDDGAELACHWGGPRPPVFHDGLHVPRAFLHGVSDCFSLICDHYAEVIGHPMEDCPRDWEWWVNPKTEGGLYLDNLEEWGFEVISTAPHEYAAIARPGDVYLMSIRSKVPNHGGIYLGDGLLLEHMHGNLSHREPIARKLKHITHWLRPKGV
ncbi:Mov34/MPN/PAD-1 family protein [Cognatishimia sp. MH4019]|uniref:Mov34/MPN/PAD-1 family protein n=1 Tax=Cognatishimia sp. MH4019 TaxID=2854030 RepID=UPI001CD2006A|nr:Mov34/MPN/PAD-1 family protein [Cognatishimia sp. MH4019]